MKIVKPWPMPSNVANAYNSKFIVTAISVTKRACGCSRNAGTSRPRNIAYKPMPMELASAGGNKSVSPMPNAVPTTQER